VSGTISVTASASDNVGVTKVEFYLDGALQSTDLSSPYSWSWNTTTAANGSQALTSKAYDAANNVGTSTAVNVTVSNGGSDTTPPTAPSSLTASPAKRKISLSWGASSDNVGVTGYQIWRSSSAAGPFSQIATTTSTTYTNSGLTSGSTWYYQVKATDAAGNVSAASNTASATAK
jgi:fibronectin type 3 domain-containing protein